MRSTIRYAPVCSSWIACVTKRAEFVAPPVNIPVAIVAGWTLFQEKEDTTAAHRFAIALDGRTMERHFRAYETQYFNGRQSSLLANLHKALDDIEALRRLPANTFGSVYALYMDRNNLSFPTFVDECVRMHEVYYAGAQTSEAQKSWFMMNNICHDFFHVVGGYDIDALGELCVQSFFAAQSGSRAASLLSRIGATVATFAAPGTQARKMVAHAYQQGLSAVSFALVDWAAMLDCPLSDVRVELNVTQNELYEHIPKDRRDTILVGKGART